MASSTEPEGSEELTKTTSTQKMVTQHPKSGQARFRLSYDNQSQSHFGKLSAEIRLKILRNLLKSPSPIRSVAEYFRRPKVSEEERKAYESTLHFSSQILSTCQLLHDEGYRVLYRENVLNIQFNSCSFAGHLRSPGFDTSCAVFDVIAHLPTSLTKCPIENCSLEEYLRYHIHNDEHVGSGHTFRGNDFWGPKSEVSSRDQLLRGYYDLLNAYRAVRRFQTLRIIIMSHPRLFSIAMRLLLSCLEGKDVIYFKAGPRPSTLREYELRFELRVCQRLDCKSLKIEMQETFDERSIELVRRFSADNMHNAVQNAGSQASRLLLDDELREWCLL